MDGFADSVSGFLIMLGIVHNTPNKYFPHSRRNWLIWQTSVFATSLDLTRKQNLIIFELCHIYLQLVGKGQMASTSKGAQFPWRGTYQLVKNVSIIAAWWIALWHCVWFIHTRLDSRWPQTVSPVMALKVISQGHSMRQYKSLPCSWNEIWRHTEGL
jgi:hypothetical protein